ncbi:hypothetical protein ABT337_27240 [Saccharopolyspora hirsuta]|uniref:Uncharacterized protein n=1 Tax=Saccharopolyspora hirsuta TaxID=1837 RepID=A0A5M7C518_SACHI|nr:hypothetical protein [Saccharopolyspora hirsuta]KAA5837092.1 hypothetical protein F1721_04525 [Saccharopolyspora hirsuta]
MAIYPLITLLLWVAAPLVERLPVYVTTLLLSATLVFLMTFVIMPFMTRLYAPWLTGVRQEQATNPDVRSSTLPGSGPQRVANAPPLRWRFLAGDAAGFGGEQEQRERHGVVRGSGAADRGLLAELLGSFCGHVPLKNSMSAM